MKSLKDHPPTSAFAVPLLRVVLLAGVMVLAAGCATTINTVSADRRLVEVVFPEDDKPSDEMFHAVVTLWMSEKNLGSDVLVYKWDRRGGSIPQEDAGIRAQQCQRLLMMLSEPTNLPLASNQIVTVRCFDGDKTLEKQFSINRVPPEVRQMLAIMGFEDDQISPRLKFVPDTPLPPAVVALLRGLDKTWVVHDANEVSFTNTTEK
ncbi:MAG: hypothetical protein WAO02_17315 [Verrucomicrobiia bacterium]